MTPAQPTDQSNTRGLAIRTGVVVVLAAAGIFSLLGFLLALLLEADGFGGPRDTGARTGYMLGYGVGAVASVAVPLAAAWLLLPSKRRWVLAAALTAVLLLGVALLGVTI